MLLKASLLFTFLIGLAMGLLGYRYREQLQAAASAGSGQ